MLITKINNIQELRLRKGAANSAIELLGLSTINDGNGGVFYWDASSVLVDDGQNVIQVTGVATGRWIRISGDSASQIQSDWNQANNTLPDYIKNKPTIPGPQVNADWNSVSGLSQILNKPTLALVATTNNYNDLSNLPSIPAAQVNSDWLSSTGVSRILNKPTTVAGYGITDVYTKTQSDGLYIPLAQKGAINGVATLGATGKVPLSQLALTTADVPESTYLYYQDARVQAFSDTRYTPLTRTLTVGTGMTGGGDFTANRSIGLNFSYLDDRYLSGYKQRNPVRIATTANITLSGTQTIDGVAVVAGDRVLVKNQTAGQDNGIYIVAAGAWTRATDFDQAVAGEIEQGSQIFVQEGTANNKTGWSLSTGGVITVGTTPLTFIQYAGANSYSAGTGLTLTGSTFAAQTTTALWNAVSLRGIGISTTAPTSSQLLRYDGTNWSPFTPNYLTGELDPVAQGKTVTVSGTTPITVAGGAQTVGNNPSFTISHAVSGVTAGTYPKVTVDVNGHVTAGTVLVAADIPNLDANKITTGTIAAARLGSGSPSATTALFGDSTYKTVLTSFTETDPIANAKTITITGTSPIVVTGAAQTIGNNPSFALTHVLSGVSAGTYNNVTVNTFGHVTAGSNVAYLTGNQTITLSGDISGSGTTAITTVLKNTGTAGTYTKVTTDAQGRVTAGTTLIAADIPALDAGKITTGVFNTARLGSGTASSTTYLRGDGAWAAIPAPGTGTVTSVAVTSTDLTVAGSPITTSGTITLTLPTLVTSGTYKSVTVNAKGQVTGGTNPITLAGFGITDAYTQVQSDTNFIQNQTSVAQPGNGFWTSGSMNGAILRVANPVATSGGDIGLFEGSGLVSANLRWRIIRSGTEGSGNTGNDFSLQSFTNTGAAWANPFSINRSTSIVTMAGGFRSANASGITRSGANSILYFYDTDNSTQLGYSGTINGDAYLASAAGSVNLRPQNAQVFQLNPTSLSVTTGNLSLANGVSNLLSFATVGLGAPTFTTTSVGTKISLWPGLSSTAANWAIGMESTALWFGIPQTGNGNGFKWYAGTTQVGRLDGLGSSEWEGQARFKGWYTANGTGPAAEVGYTSAQARVAGFDRTALTYIPLQLYAGNSASALSLLINGTGFTYNTPSAGVASSMDLSGNQEWAGSGRFKGVPSPTAPGTGLAAEIGLASGTGIFQSYNKTTGVYAPTRIIGGSTASDSKTLQVDGTGYRFANLTSATYLGTDSSGYLISKTVAVPTLDQVVTAGNSTSQGISVGQVETLSVNSGGPLPLTIGTNSSTRLTIQSTGEALFTNKVTAPNIQLTTGAGAGKVLTSDASGNGIWQATIRRLATFTTSVGNSSNGATMYTYTVPAATLNVDGDSIDFVFGGSFAATGTNKIVTLNIGSLNTALSAGTLSGGNWNIKGTIIRVNSTTIRYTCAFVYSGTANTTPVIADALNVTVSNLATNGFVISLVGASAPNDVVSMIGSITLFPI